MNENVLEQLHHQAVSIFEDALAACDIDRAFGRHLRVEGRTLFHNLLIPGDSPQAINLNRYKRVLVIAFGKASATMLDALLRRMPHSMDIRGVCSSPDRPAMRHRHFSYYCGGHPLPNRDSLAAARDALELLRKAKKDTLVIFLISGGGSAMLELPLDKDLSLEDTTAFHETLVASGATITEVNVVRKFFSAVKGGRLAHAAPDSDKLSLVVADVPLREQEAVASSPTLPSHTLLSECDELLDRYHLLEQFPASVRHFFEDLHTGKYPLPPNPDDAAFSNTAFEILLSNQDFVAAAQASAEALEFNVVVDNSCDDWDYEKASRYLLDRFHALRKEHRRLCLISSGELTVHLPADHGCGGRNQQFALVCAFDLARTEDRQLLVFSAGSDGVDGNSPAAGAAVDSTTIARAQQQQFDPEAHLRGFDACPLFTAIGDTIVTGPTGNNLRDLRVFLAVESGSGLDHVKE